jgi:hypothetical protein
MFGEYLNLVSRRNTFDFFFCFHRYAMSMDFCVYRKQKISDAFPDLYE